MGEQDMEATLFSVSPEQGQVDGHRGDEAADHDEEGQRRLQVFSAIGDYMGKKNRKRKGRVYGN